MLRVKINQFDNSIIRDNKTVTLRDAPCENKTIRKFDNSGQKENSCEKTVTSATIRVKSKHDIPREEPRVTAALSPGKIYGSIALHSLSSGTPAETSITVFETGCTNSTLRLIRDIDPSGLLRGAPYFKSPFMGHPIAAS